MKRIFSSTLRLSFLSLLLLPFSNTSACGWWDPWDGIESLWDATVINSPEMEAFLYSPDLWHDYEVEPRDLQRQENIEDWKKYFGKNSSEDEIEWLVYRAESSELDQLDRYLSGGTRTLPETFGAPGIAESLKSKKDKELVEYLRYVKLVEPHMYVESEWDELEVDDAMFRNLRVRGESLYDRTKSDFLKLRIAYHVVRIGHYSGNFRQCVESYDNLIPGLKADGPIRYWALGHKAGALRRLGDLGQSAYCYSVVWDHSPGRRMSAKLSFLLETEAQWDQALSHAESSRERAGLYTLRAIQPGAIPMEDMSQILSIYPESPYLPLLLSRAIHLVESHEGAKASELKAVVDRALRTQSVQNKPLWELASAYVDWMNGKYESSLRKSQDILAGNQSGSWMRQAKTVELFSEMHLADRINPENEQSFYKRLHGLLEGTESEELKHDMDFHFMEVMGEKYAAQSEPGRAWLCTHDLYDLYYHCNAQPAADLVKEVPNWSSNSLTARIGSRIYGSEENPLDKGGVLNTLYDYLGTLQLKQGNYKTAIAEFDKMVETEQEGSFLGEGWEPFTGVWRDCHECSSGTEIMNKKEYCQAMLDFEKKGKSGGNGDERAQAWLKYGHGIYNTSYYGYAWNFTMYERSGSDWWYGGGKKEEHKDSWYPGCIQLDLSAAESAYVRAIQEAKDPEIAAEAAYYLAKTWYMNHYAISDNYRNMLQRNEGFIKLARDYSGTDFYQDAVANCSYFRDYLKGL